MSKIAKKSVKNKKEILFLVHEKELLLLIRQIVVFAGLKLEQFKKSKKKNIKTDGIMNKEINELFEDCKKSSLKLNHKNLGIAIYNIYKNNLNAEIRALSWHNIDSF